jgi:hypothetical protein
MAKTLRSDNGFKNMQREQGSDFMGKSYIGKTSRNMLNMG